MNIYSNLGGLIIKHILTLKELSEHEIGDIVIEGMKVKKQPEDYYSALEKKGLLLMFQKTSTRTTLSYQSAINQLGGYAVELDWDKSNFTISPIQYESRYASRNCDIMMARLKKFSDIVELAKYSSVPVINGCCDKYHPSQALADMMTIYEIKKQFDGVTLTFAGIHNNVTNSLIIAALKLGVKLQLVTPMINEASWDKELMEEAKKSGNIIHLSGLEAALATTDFIYTDTWVDMEYFNDPMYDKEKQTRIEQMSPYSITMENLKGYTPYIMHDMPVHPGFEIEEDLIESENSIIYTQAENRMHAQKALLMHLLMK
ncbi:ornithine carbamoyltransferase [Bacillus pakistanensis]|uniref:Ornithine carbamoyltransferase n=1 Tax=Rossellomorea pakistanensis TaxID=992288 RepID=A0ABS2N9Q3_9BACI|nr:ornithine carbamoyltransferase [Bacillus pakistanensis]MBM7584586.1 ornithine carbamoyltransferase [Bacillus pakistanensis]